MKIQSCKISLWGVKIFFIITIFFSLSFLYFWIGIGKAPEGAAIMGILFIISFVIGMILYFLVKLMKSERYKKIGGFFSFLIGTILLITGMFLISISNLNDIDIDKVVYLLLSLCLLVSGLFLIYGGFLSLSEKVEKLTRKRTIVYIVFMLLLIVFLPNILIILMGIKFDENHSVKECQYDYKERIIIENIYSYFGKDVSYGTDVNCYSKVARKNLDVELCKKLPVYGPGNLNQNDCLSYVALEKNNPLICLDMIEDSFRYPRCVNSISKKYNNHSICDDINLPEFSTCEEREINARCYLEATGIERDINICNKDK